MITLYTGTPGSGKSLDVARKIRLKLKMGHNVIGTMSVKKDCVKDYRGKYIYVNIYKLNPYELIEYAKKFHAKGKEGQTYIVIDECQRIFNTRDWAKKEMRAWNDFFQLHRHFGFNVWLITQWDQLLDSQTRALVEYNNIHRKLSCYGLGGLILGGICRLFDTDIFVNVEMWYAIRKQTGAYYFLRRKKDTDFYDSYIEFEGSEEKDELAPLLLGQNKDSDGEE